MNPSSDATKHYLFASDFDQTLSFNDSGVVLSEMLGLTGFHEKVSGLARVNLVQQGAELTYLLRHDPQYRGVRREHLVETGKRVRLKQNVAQLADFLRQATEEYRFTFNVISASPRVVVQSALEGIVPPENVFGTELDFDPHTGEICEVRRVPAGYGKVALLQEIQARLHIRPDYTVYVGDGSSDMHVMQHVNSVDGLTIAVSETKSVGRIAKRSVLSDNALSVLVPRRRGPMGSGADPRSVRRLRPSAPGVGQDPHGLADLPRARPAGDGGRPRTAPGHPRGLIGPDLFISTLMNYHLFQECLGWVAAASFASSYLWKTQGALRRAQAVGALLWVAYGVATGSLPVIVTNVAVVFMAVAYPLLRRRWETPMSPTHEPAKQSRAEQGLRTA